MSGFYTDLNAAQWAILAPLLPPAKPGGRPRTTSLRGVLDAVFYLLRTGCQWRLLTRLLPPWGTVYHYFRLWQRTGLGVRLHRAAYALARAAAGRPSCPSLVIMDGQSVKTTERGGMRDFDGHKLVRGRKRHISRIRSGCRSPAGSSLPTCQTRRQVRGCSPACGHSFLQSAR